MKETGTLRAVKKKHENSKKNALALLCRHPFKIGIWCNAQSFKQAHSFEVQVTHYYVNHSQKFETSHWRRKPFLFDFITYSVCAVYNRPINVRTGHIYTVLAKSLSTVFS